MGITKRTTGIKWGNFPQFLIATIAIYTMSITHSRQTNVKRRLGVKYTEHKYARVFIP